MFLPLSFLLLTLRQFSIHRLYGHDRIRETRVLSQRKYHIQTEQVIRRMNRHLSSVFFRRHADTSQAESMITFIFLRRSGEPFGHIPLLPFEIIFYMYCDKPSHCLHRQMDKPLFFIFQFFHILNGVRSPFVKSCCTLLALYHSYLGLLSAFVIIFPDYGQFFGEINTRAKF